MNMPKTALLLIFSALLFSPCYGYFTPDPASSHLKVVIIRHGEKPANGDNLSCQGQNRAIALPAILYNKFGVPDFTYVPTISTGKQTNHARMFQTVTPFAIQYNLTVNSKYDEKDVMGVAAEILKKNGTVLLVWEHSVINSIAEALGVKNVKPWPDDDFDSIWIITISKSGAVMTTEKEGIHPSPNCK